MKLLHRLEDTCIKPNPDFDQLLKVLWHNDLPKYIPFYELFVNTEIMASCLGKEVSDAVSSIEFYYKAGYDYVPAWPQLKLKLGSLVETSSEYPIKDWQSFDEYQWPDISSISYAEFESIIPKLPEGMKVIGQTGGVFETMQALCGYTNLCCMMYDDPELIRAIFSKISFLYEAMYRGMAEIEQVGAIVISDDMGFKTQTLISPSHLREFVLPVHKKLAEIIHSYGKPCILHSCGNLSTIMEDIISEVKVDAKHSYEDTILPVTEAKKLYGERIAILGGFDLDALCNGTELQIREHSVKLINYCGKAGGYAFGTGNSVAGYVPITNYLAMLDEGWKTRRENVLLSKR